MLAPRSSLQVIARISTTSTTPRCASSCPIGIWIGTGFAPRRSTIDWTALKKSAPVRSILLMNAIRGTLYLSACRQTVSDWGWTPATLSKTATAPSGTRRLPSTPHGEVHVSGRINNVDPMVAPRRRRRRRGDRDAALLLLRHPVHRRGALVD